ncbi:MAG: ketose-bisphosphate aldolase [Acidobacteria bacterium]|nr:MAG: ketose-bisphosphate aldolase [Acidobacteriota bacterium]
MPLVTLTDVLRDAAKARYAVGAFNVVGIEFLEAIMEAAEARRSPVILAIGEPHFPFVNPDHICPAILAMAHRSSVPVVLHLDHGGTFEGVLRSLRTGFTSVMFDGSKLDYGENVRQTREVVRVCAALKVPVEAELGAVGGSETGRVEGTADAGLFTDPDQARDFVGRTGVDALAVAIGNVHGKYRGEPKLDFDRLRRIREKAEVPLVLHGGTGISADDFRRAMALGIAKINVYTGMSQAGLQAVGDFCRNMGDGYHDYPLMLSQLKARVRCVVDAHIDMFGSAGKA